MSTEVDAQIDSAAGMRGLTALGKRVEVLRIERGLSKQQLARLVGASRQQLWRVATGSSELTSSLRRRLATALCVDPSSLAASGTAAPGLLGSAVSYSSEGPTIGDYFFDAQHITATLSSLPNGDEGRRLKRALLNALEDLAVDSQRSLPNEYSEIRRRVLVGEL